MTGDFHFSVRSSISSTAHAHEDCGFEPDDRRASLGSSERFREMLGRIQADPRVPEDMKEMVEEMLGRALSGSRLRLGRLDKPDNCDRRGRDWQDEPPREAPAHRHHGGPLVGVAPSPERGNTKTPPQEKPSTTAPTPPTPASDNSGATGNNTSSTNFLDAAVKSGLLKGDAGLIEEIKNLAKKDPDLRQALAKYFGAGYPLDINKGIIPDTTPGTMIVGQAKSRVFRESGEYAGTTITIEDRPRPEDRTKTIGHELTHMLNFAKIVPGAEHDEQFHASMDALTDGAKTQGFKLIG